MRVVSKDLMRLEPEAKAEFSTCKKSGKQSMLYILNEQLVCANKKPGCGRKRQMCGKII